MRSARLICHGAAPGPWNMAVDELLLAAAASGGGVAVRLYAWRGPWLSLGYGQRLEGARRAACAAAGVGVVRRATGGGAVLHGADLTYTVAAPASLLPAGLDACYARLADALLEALRSQGVSAGRAGAAAGAAPPGFDCFARAAAHEICAGGRKLVGSAQRRTGAGVLQHGSLRLAPDPPQAARAAGLEARGSTSLRELGWCGSLDSLRGALAEALGAALGCSLEAGDLSPGERRAARATALGRARSAGKLPRIAGLAVSRAPSFGR